MRLFSFGFVEFPMSLAGRHVLMSIAALASLTLAPSAPVGADESKFTSAELLAWAEDDQRIWIGAAVEGFASAYYLVDQEIGQCIWDWYGDGSVQFVTFTNYAREFPDSEPMVVLMTLANRSCHFRSGG